MLHGAFLLSSTCPPSSPSLSPSLNSILIRFNLLFNSRTLWSLLFFDRLLAFPSLSSSLSPPPSIYSFQVFILFSISSSFHSLSHFKVRERGRSQEKKGGKRGESEEILREIEKLHEESKGDERTKEDEGREGQRGKRAGVL